MPCEYQSVTLQISEKERELERQKAIQDAKGREEERKRQIKKKKEALIMALLTLGYELDAESLGDGKTIINCKQKVGD